MRLSAPVTGSMWPPRSSSMTISIKKARASAKSSTSRSERTAWITMPSEAMMMTVPMAMLSARETACL